jgi:hypothetical protein
VIGINNGAWMAYDGRWKLAKHSTDERPRVWP